MTNQTQAGTAVITGASGGIGAIYADRLARRGHDLLLVARNEGRLNKIAAQLRNQTGRTVEVLVADLTAPAELLALETRLREDSGITVLVNSAGGGTLAALTSAQPDQLAAMLELNVTVLTRLTAAAVGGMAGRRQGTIINISSALAVYFMPFGSAYSGAKSYVLTFTQALQQELAGTGVRAQAVVFGFTRTEFWERGGVPLSNLPAELLMEPGEAVDAALAGLANGELVTIPALPDVGDWDALDAARVRVASRAAAEHAAGRFSVGR